MAIKTLGSWAQNVNAVFAPSQATNKPISKKIRTHGAARAAPKRIMVAVAPKKENPNALLEQELKTCLQNFKELSDDEKKQVKKLLFGDSSLKMIDIEIANRFHITEQSNSIRMEVLKLLCDKELSFNDVYITDVIGYSEQEFTAYANKELPVEYEQKLADMIQPYPLWQEQLFRVLCIDRKPINDVCIAKLTEIAVADDSSLFDAEYIIDELMAMNIISISAAVSIFIKKKPNDKQQIKFIKSYPDSAKYFQLL